MKRTWIILLAIAVALAIALPAGAKKPEKPDRRAPGFAQSRVRSTTSYSSPRPSAQSNLGSTPCIPPIPRSVTCCAPR